MRLALIGNPNTGKTSLFNRLTGATEHVGNWAGVTVEKKQGNLRGGRGTLLDLPGVYDLNPVSEDEAVVSRFLLESDGYGLIHILDASQLERNLQLTAQLLELGLPMKIGLNMGDVAASNGESIRAEALQDRLGVPVRHILARTGDGCVELLEAPLATAPVLHIDYGEAMEATVTQLMHLEQFERWKAVQYLIGNPVIEDIVVHQQEAEQLRERLGQELGRFIHAHVSDQRRLWAMKIRADVVSHTARNGSDLGEKLDAIITHPLFGLPVFVLTMYMLFHVTFNWIGAPLSDVLDGLLSGPVSDGMAWILEKLGASDFIERLLIDGVIAGVGGVLVFVPQIFVLFFLISFLEDSGYMARVAIVMDRFMEFVGLNGKSFIPMIIGFGCNVPGVMASRSIEAKRERMVTIFITPFMSCSARLPIYAVFAGSFFAEHQALIVLSLYVLGIVLALLAAKVFSWFVPGADGGLFIVEQPPYRLPQWLSLWRHTWAKGKGFVRKAGTFIFGGSVIIWLLTYLGPSGIDVPMSESFLALLGGTVAFILVPLGFGTWQAGAALITGFLAKEVVVSTMAIIYAVKDSDLGVHLSQQFTPLSAYSFMVFVLLYVPCLATIAVIRRELGSRKWTWIASLYGFGVAYVVAFLIYQGGRLFGLG